MSTRSNIYLKLKDESKGQTIQFDFSKLPTAHGEQHEKLEFPIKDVKIPQDAEYIGVYHHWDGYPENLGKTLLEQYNDYDTILNLLLGGDASTINNNNVCQYCAWRGEDWEYVKPKQLDKPAFNEEYLYKFENGVWYFRDEYENEDWTNLKEYLNMQ